MNRDRTRTGEIMSTIAYLTLAVAAAAILGIWIGLIRIRGIGLGIGGVLFSGIFVGHMLSQHLGFAVRTADGALTAEGSILGYVQEFGLILFVYAIGIQVGPSFFSSLRSMGARMNGYAALIVLLSCAMAMLMHVTGLVQMDVMVGMYSGAITNTPALGAATSMISELAQTFMEAGQPVPPGFDDMMVSSAYAMAYPFGVVGLLLTIVLLRIVFGINTERAGREYEESKAQGRPAITTINVQMQNEELFGKTITEIFDTLEITDHGVVCSRVRRGDEVSVPTPEFRLQEGDILHLVGATGFIGLVARSIGKPTKVDVSTAGSHSKVHVAQLIVTNPRIFGRPFGSLHLDTRYDLAASRLHRSGFEFVPTHDMHLQFGDAIHVVGERKNIDEAAELVGNSKDKLNKVEMLPIFVGIFLGIFLGSIPFQITCIPMPIKLGLAGGPLVVALLLSRYGSSWTLGRMSWYMPAAGLSALREIGITLFLSIVGINAGANGFWETLVHGPGLQWLALGMLITFVPMFIVGVLALKVSGMNYLIVSGMLAGASTSPPALAFTTAMYSNPEPASLGYATVYPLTMFLRILSPQLMIILAMMLA